MTLWKKNWLGREPGKSNNSPDKFSEFKNTITVIRRQGDPPVKDPGTFSQYLCDLCSTPHPVSGLRQCVLCGRWACEGCWKDDLYTCRSCSGLLKIHLMKHSD